MRYLFANLIDLSKLVQIGFNSSMDTIKLLGKFSSCQSDFFNHRQQSVVIDLFGPISAWLIFEIIVSGTEAFVLIKARNAVDGILTKCCAYPFMCLGGVGVAFEVVEDNGTQKFLR